MRVFKFIGANFGLLAIIVGAAFSANCATAAASQCQTFAPVAADFASDKNNDFETSGAQIAQNVFYVSSSTGDDARDGKTRKTAWRTIAKVNATAFKPGAQILFRGGDVWREQLNVSSGGAKNDLIVFGAYSEGNSTKMPIISGADVVADFQVAALNVANDSANKIYVARLETAPANVYVDDETIALGKCDDLNKLAAEKSGWFYDDAAKKLFVKLGTNDSIAQHRIEVAARDFNIYANDKAFVRVDKLNLRRARFSAIEVAGDASDAWTISNCAFGNMTVAAINAHPADQSNAGFLEDWTVENNLVGRIDQRAALDYDRAGILLRHTKNAFVRNNSVATQTQMGITIRDYFKAGGSEGGTVTNNRLTNNQGNISIWMTTNAVVTNNRIFKSKGYGIGVGVRSHNVLIAYNTINFLRESDDETLYNGIDVNSNSQNGKIFHNTIVNVRGFNLTLEQADAPSNGWTVRNNIFDASDAPFHRHSNIAVDPDVNVYTFSNNIYVGRRARPEIVNHWHRQDMTFAEWTAATDDKDSIAADPRFKNPNADDLTVTNDSPAIGKAARIAGVNDNKPLNIGAF